MIALVIICNDGAVLTASDGTAGVLEWSRNINRLTDHIGTAL
jgi:hypothetical protein